ncbi:MAG: Jag N-terminal domain-containing protein [Clostridia bacterium]|nr:Jag N-terminal domain-containing protein [Clostridia bacterium]
MEKSIITIGKTIDLAIAAAAAQLGLDRDDFNVEVLENAKSGFLGIGASPAKIKVTYEVPDEKTEPKPALSSASRSKPKEKKPAPKQEKKPEPKPAPKAEPAKPAKQERAPRPERPASPQAPAAPKEYAPAEPGSKEEAIEIFVKGLLEHMGSDAVPHCAKNSEEGYDVELVGQNLGMLIGRRGDTLNAIQHLTNYAINRDANKRSRITVDAENYRGKREESLEHLANKMAAKAVKYRKNFTLEPMNAYDRHIIHAALQDTPNVTTFSTGTEPNRRIVIAYEKG